MILFWLICASFVAIALAFVLPPLLQQSGKGDGEQSKEEANIDVYRGQLSELETDLRNGIVSQEQYEQDREEIERRLLDDVSNTAEPTDKKSKPAAAGRVPVYAIALGIPIIAVAMYLRVGDRAALSPPPNGPFQAPFAAGSQSNGQMTQQGMEANVAALAKRMEENPGDAAGWIMLGRSYATMERYSEARDAYAKAAAIKSDDADLLADYAFAVAMANGRQLQGQPLDLVRKALKLDPENLKALELAGTAEFQAKNYKQAIEYWQRILAKTPPNSELTQALTQRIDEAKSLAGTNASKN
ncbi:MAG TPA: c-type cytochrome biogenesis protein CcmI [Blastocatellia bacterium]|jgi:cytochrome c-type biogenesis protein CcmH|nr:c-type cytochrome biogenesis protein CcmI [Blastocatellia bacterium]HAF24303.1 c-type cytochrome biogenesis protein CcmI [Blastocatellia bacterium]HCX29187.1 c-type cytochrome biogenesis protein CcmI [Blastocatellia bacterium]